MFMGNVSSIMVSRTGRIAGEAMGAAILMAMPCHAQAQQAADEPIIVTGERADRSIAQTSSSVLVIIDQDLERQPDTDRLEFQPMTLQCPSELLLGDSFAVLLAGQTFQSS